MNTPRSTYSTRLAAANKTTILEALKPGPLRRDEVVTATGLSRQCVYRYMLKMANERILVKPDGDTRYSLAPDTTLVAAYMALQQDQARYTSPKGLNDLAMVQPDTTRSRRVAANKLAILARLKDGPMRRIDVRDLLGLSASAANNYIAELHSAHVIDVHCTSESFWLATDDDQPTRLALLVEQLTARAGDTPAACPGTRTKLAPNTKPGTVYKGAVHMMVDDEAYHPRKHDMAVHRDPLVAALFGPAVPA